MVSLITAIEIATNKILIDTGRDKETKKWASFMYMKIDGQIHKMWLSTDAVFDTEKEAKKYMQVIAKFCVKKYRKALGE